MKNWQDVVSTPEFKYLSDEQRCTARDLYSDESKEGKHGEMVEILKANAELIVSAIFESNQSVKELLKTLVEKEDKEIVFEQKEPVTEWDFDIVRDKDDFIKSIKAKASGD